jgi:hypothetical protein
MGATLLGDEKTGDLALHPRRHHDRARLCERLDPRRSVWRIAVNFPRRINYHRAGFDADARAERWLARSCILAVDLSERALNRQGSPRCAFGVVLLRARAAEGRQVDGSSGWHRAASHGGRRKFFGRRKGSLLRQGSFVPAWALMKKLNRGARTDAFH